MLLIVIFFFLNDGDADVKKPNVPKTYDTYIHACMHAYIHTTHIYADRQTHRQTYIQTDRQIDRQTDRQTDIYTFIQTENILWYKISKQTDRQTDGQIYYGIQKDRHNMVQTHHGTDIYTADRYNIHSYTQTVRHNTVQTNIQTGKHTLGRLSEDVLRGLTSLAGSILIICYNAELIGSVGLKCLHYKQCLWLLYNWQPLSQPFLQLLHLHT